MKRRWLIRIAAVLAGLVALLYVVGLFIPRDHVASMTIGLNAPAERIWPLVSDFEHTVNWRTDISAVRMQPQPEVTLRFTETSSQGDVTFEVVSQHPPTGQVVRVVDDDQPFGGTWTWLLEPAGAGTKLTITEAGFVKSPIFRSLGAVFFSPTETIDAYMRALAKALGETATPTLAAAK